MAVRVLSTQTVHSSTATVPILSALDWTLFPRRTGRSERTIYFRNVSTWWYSNQTCHTKVDGWF